MLRDGQFIREAPPKIGAHYIPTYYKRNATAEERFTQDVLLGINPYTITVMDKILGKLLRL